MWPTKLIFPLGSTRVIPEFRSRNKPWDHSPVWSQNKQTKPSFNLERYLYKLYFLEGFAFLAWLSKGWSNSVYIFGRIEGVYWSIFMKENVGHKQVVNMYCWFKNFWRVWFLGIVKRGKTSSVRGICSIVANSSVYSSQRSGFWSVQIIFTVMFWLN